MDFHSMIGKLRAIESLGVTKNYVAEEETTNEDSKCTMTAEGESCPVHGLTECPMVPMEEGDIDVLKGMLKNSGQNLVIVVGLNAPDSAIISPPQKDAQGRSFISMPGWLSDYRNKMRQYFPEQEKVEKSTSLSSFNLMTRAFDLLQDRFCELLVAQYPVDIVVQVARNQAGTLEFHRAAELIEIGRQKAVKAIDEWENANS